MPTKPLHRPLHRSRLSQGKWKFIPCKNKQNKNTNTNTNTNSKTSKSVYGFNPSTSEYKTWPSISECTKFCKEAN